MSVFKKIYRTFFALRRLLGKEKDLIENEKRISQKKHTLFKNVELIHSTVGDFSYIAQNSILAYTNVGKFCSIGPNVISGYGEHPLNMISTSPLFYSETKIISQDFYSTGFFDGYGKVNIENDVWIGANVYIKNGIKIGNGAVVGAGAVVLHDVPDYAIIVGVPAKIVRYRFDEKTIQSLLKIKWWNWDEQKIAVAKKYFSESDMSKFLEAYGE